MLLSTTINCRSPTFTVRHSQEDSPWCPFEPYSQFEVRLAQRDIMRWTATAQGRCSPDNNQPYSVITHPDRNPPLPLHHCWCIAVLLRTVYHSSQTAPEPCSDALLMPQLIWSVSSWFTTYTHTLIWSWESSLEAARLWQEHVGC